MRYFIRGLLGALLWVGISTAQADGFRASYTQEAQPGSAEQRPCGGCDCGGGNSTGFAGASVADPIWTKDGSLHLSYADIAIGAVFPIQIVRNYDSRAEYDSAVGYGWSFEHDQRLFEYPDGSIIIRSGCGRRDKYVFSGGAYVTPQGGSQGQLTEKPDGTYEFRYRSGSRDLYDVDGRLVARVERSGARQEFLYDSRGKLPLVGTSPRAVDPNAPMVVAYQPRITKIQERGADNTLTGYFVNFVYEDTTGRLLTLTASDGRQISYAHDVTGTATRGNLVSVSGLTDYAQTFAYADPNDKHNLTTIIDGAGAEPVVNTFDTSDRVTKQVEGSSTFALTYPSLGVTEVTETVKNSAGSILQTRVSRREYNAAGYLVKNTDPNGHELRYTYDANNQISRTELWEKSGTTLALVKAVDTTYTAQGLKLTESVTLDSGEVVTKTWTYDNGWVSSEQTASTASAQLFRTEYTFNRDAGGIPITIASVKARKDDGTFATTSYTYCSAADAAATNTACPDTSLVKSINGPRTDVSDVSTFTYYGSTDTSGCDQATGNCFRRGDLKSVVNALNQEVEFLRYDASGRPNRIRDANNVVAEMTYHPRGWLQQSTVRGADDAVTTDDAITQYQVDARGNLTQLTSPDGNTITMTYDARDRLTKIRDQAGNEVRYTLDSVGNRTKKETYDSGNTQRRVQSFVYDKWSRLVQLTGSTAAQTTNITYDAAGRATSIIDPNLVEATRAYDDLDRLISSVADAKAGGIQAGTQYSYDAVGNLKQVTDPKGLATSYVYDSLGRLGQQSSPDSGTTSYTYDDAGNRKSQTDARGVISNYTYDALNRLLTVTYPTTAEGVTYTYDAANAACAIGETFATGRLTKMADQSGTTEYCYDRFGNVVRKVQSTAGLAFTVRYSYTLANQLKTLTYPDGAVVDYTRDTQSRIREIGVALGGGARQVLLGNATYYPAGPSSGWTFGNGRTLNRVYDKDYRASTIKDAGVNGLDIGLRYDNAGYLTQLTNAALATTPKTKYAYDARGRLLRTSDGSTNAAIETYTYDATGNRTSVALGAAAAQAYTYEAASHRLTQVDGVARDYDAAGNLTASGGTAREYAYNDAGRMSVTKQAGIVKATYEYNGLGEQVRRVTSASTVFIYDEAGHTLGQYNSTGTPLHQYVWMDDQPVGVIANDALHYVESDHLGTPRAVIDATRQKAIWIWDLKSEVFGSSVAATDPDADGIDFVYDLRFPGQRYDSASGMNYNYYRDYEPRVGRYTQSDPIGLWGGVSTFGYVGGSPLIAADPRGLQQRPVNTYSTEYHTRNDMPGVRTSPPGEHVYRDAWSMAEQLSKSAFIKAFDEDNDGDTHCAELIKHRRVFDAAPTWEWRAGRPIVPGMQIEVGTAIATFDENGRYPSGDVKHAAIFIAFSQDGNGIYVLDQWDGTSLQYRDLPWRYQGSNAHTNYVNSASSFSTIIW
ncbi:BPSL0067 family protein [Pseudoxanthomonas sacheonensis]|uniref:RHS repeat-associated protein n=1 Tax=Pseudoxanthomonas sacheonensis TaxID=443615 RepID=A0ABU1RR04_9GAMM|nr:BPSL0067 family protein [Pseudoxanthomonas sacheonensis]MDR6841213.1 RHS repeat-associated protein [Pseudoxanthomonas sacheonensis]